MFYKVKKALGFCKFIEDKGHEIINFSKQLAHLKVAKNINTVMFLKYICI